MRAARLKVFIIFSVIFVMFNNAAVGQSSKKLKSRRSSIEKTIKETNTLIKKARSQKVSTLNELELINETINLREEKLTVIHQEVRNLDKKIKHNEALIIALEEDISRLKEEYKKMMILAYKTRDKKDMLMYVFSSEDFDEAYLRLKYLEKYKENRIAKAKIIIETGERLNRQILEIETQKTEKATLAKLELNEKKELLSDKDSQSRVLGALRKDESKLLAQLRAQEKKRREISNKIKAALAEEMRKAEERRRKQSATGKSGSVMTPEAKQLSISFAGNKGKLPWPVEKGVITGKFGHQPHPAIPRVFIDNNGVDITTSQDADVRAVFEGTVTSIIVVSGAGKSVIVSHGNYRTIYSNLSNVLVVKGQKIRTKQVIGRVLTDSSTKKTVAHFELWKITGSEFLKIDPSTWLFK